MDAENRTAQIAGDSRKIRIDDVSETLKNPASFDLVSLFAHRVINEERPPLECNIS